MSYSAANTMENLINKISASYTPVTGTPIEQLDKRLSLLRRDV
jgi:hypothetical protein